jgi:hypothetical protein
LFFRKDFLQGLKLPHEILCPSRSDNNHRAAGAVGSVHGWISIFHKSSLLKVVGPAARLSVYSVYSVDSKMLIFRAFRAFRGSNLWLVD